MTDVRKAEELARLKSEIKALTTEAKKLEKELLETGASDKIVTSYGTLSLTTRPSYSCLDKERLFDEIGQGAFVKIATVSYGTVKKELGELRGEMLLANSHFRLKSTSKFYTLRT